MVSARAEGDAVKHLDRTCGTTRPDPLPVEGAARAQRISPAVSPEQTSSPARILWERVPEIVLLWVLAGFLVWAAIRFAGMLERTGTPRREGALLFAAFAAAGAFALRRAVTRGRRLRIRPEALAKGQGDPPIARDQARRGPLKGVQG